MSENMIQTETVVVTTVNPVTVRVKTLMLQKGVKQVDIVNAFSFDKGDVSKVIKGERRTPKIQTAIAEKLGLSVGEVFDAQ